MPPWTMDAFHSLSSPTPLLAPRTKKAGNQETTAKAGIFPQVFASKADKGFCWHLQVKETGDHPSYQFR